MNLITIDLNKYKAHPQNPNTHPDFQIDELGKSLDKFGQFKNVVVWNGYYLAGHGLVESAKKKGLRQLQAVDVSHLSEKDAKALMIADNQLPELAVMDMDILGELVAGFEVPMDDIPGVDDEFLQGLGLGEPEPEAEEDEGGAIDKAEQLREEYGVKLGQVWELGRHRVICGDCTDGGTVDKVMGREVATLCHADPPYGMGKEKDGILNDNLYREKLDRFQLQWWKVARQKLEDNASAYIWGNAEDLWRFWYSGGLRDSERLTLRNEIVWNKGDAGAGGISHMGADGLRLYPMATERCLFFMLGEQGFNNNADNYWEGWEPILAYLRGQKKAMEWTASIIHEILGSADNGGGLASHYFGRSQWSFITREHYQKLQKAANGQAFKREYDSLKREYDALKREFYSTRAYFDNTHDLMTDVWDYNRVQGEERHGHATPKPVKMISRIILSSSKKDDIVYSPFLGSGTDLIACEQLGRHCRAAELDPGYIAVTLNRWETLTGQKAKLIEASQ